MTASGTLETEYIALSETEDEVLVLRQMQDFMELSVRILHVRRREGSSTLM